VIIFIPIPGLFDGYHITPHALKINPMDSWVGHRRQPRNTVGKIRTVRFSERNGED